MLSALASAVIILSLGSDFPFLAASPSAPPAVPPISTHKPNPPTPPRKQRHIHPLAIFPLSRGRLILPKRLSTHRIHSPTHPLTYPPIYSIFLVANLRLSTAVPPNQTHPPKTRPTQISHTPK